MFKWVSSLEIGNAKIDQQHKQLVEMFNSMISACTTGKGRTELQGSLNFLIEYTVKHFNDEEALQKQVGFPDCTRHKKLHEDFKATALGFAEQLKKEGPSLHLVSKLNTTIGHWLKSHIKHEDAKISPYIKKAAS